jgi:hypothetical protein
MGEWGYTRKAPEVCLFNKSSRFAACKGVTDFISVIATNNEPYAQHFIFVITYFWAWTNFSLQDEPWAEFSTLEVAAACIPCTYCPV